jgi:hypothetical protein
LSIPAPALFRLPRRIARGGGVAWVLCAAAGAAAAPAQWTVSGGLDRLCMISFDCQAGDRCLLLRLDDRSTDQDTAVITWRCNFAVDTASMEFSSQNQGVLRNAADEIPLPYRATYTGGQGSGFADQSLVTPVRTAPSPDLPNADVTGTLQIRIGARTESLFAGRYSDRITVTITPDPQ